MAGTFGDKVKSAWDNSSTQDKVAYGSAAAQTVAGLIFASKKDKGMPTLNKVDLTNLSKNSGIFSQLAGKIKDRAVKAASYIKSAGNRSANQTFATEQKALSEKSGGNSAAYLASMGGAGLRRNKANVDTQMAAEKILSDAESKAVGIETQGAVMKNENDRFAAGVKANENDKEFQAKYAYNMEMDKQKSATAASLINAGISNAIGYGEAKNQAEITKKRKEDSIIKPEDIAGKTTNSPVNTPMTDSQMQSKLNELEQLYRDDSVGMENEIKKNKQLWDYYNKNI